MIIARLHSGLGNQMFQYAMARRISLQLGVEMKLDISVLLDPKPVEGTVKREFGLNAFTLESQFYVSPAFLRIAYLPHKRRWSKIVQKIISKPYNLEQQDKFGVEQRLLYNPPDSTIYKGFWQSERYFEAAAAMVRNDFRFRNDVLPRSEKLFAEIKSTVSVCVHVRRTDMVGPVHGVTDLEYYKACIQQMRSEVPTAWFFIFSDDIDWCRNVFANYPRATIVGTEHNGPSDINSLQLMSACRHFIIPNSTYSWWGAWLGERDDTVVMAPEKWFGTTELDYRDVIPRRWRKMKN